MYYEYWNLKKPPFDNVPDPTMYADCHASMENTIAETLFAIEEGNECIAVIVGDVGLGKTLSLRMIIDSLDQDKYKIALITNPSITFVQMLREIIGQLTGKQCDIRKKVDLFEIFNKILFETIDGGKRVLIFIDEANAMPSSNLESLRLLTNMQDDQRNLLTLILAGQNELAERLEHPKRANLFQRIGTYCRIDKIQSEDQLRTYVETRLKLAGSVKDVFTEDAYKVLWEHSEQGVPRLINKLAKLCLKAGETNGFESIDENIVKQIAERFQKMSGPLIQKRKPRKRHVNAGSASGVQKGKPEEEKTIYTPKLEKDISYSDKSFRPEGIASLQKIPDTARESAETGIRSDKITEITDCYQDEASNKMEIGGMTITVNVPCDIIQQARTCSQEHRIKLAGVVAAQTLKEYPQVTYTQSVDPVSIWGEIRDFVLSQFAEERKAASF